MVALHSQSTTKSISPSPFSGTYKALILDFGDVLFKWSVPTKSNSIPSKLLKQMMSSPTWGQYESGRISREECYSMLCERYHVDPSELGTCFFEMRKTLIYDPMLVTFVRTLKDEYGTSVFAMSNAGHEDFVHVQDHALEVDWDVFDEVFPSYAAGARKPDLKFFQHVLTRTNLDPLETIYIDDKIDNVITARSLGMRGIVFSSTQQVMQMVMSLICDPVRRASAYLTQHAGNHESFTNTGVRIIENFAQYLILEVTGDKSLITTMERQYAINFFRGKAQLTTDTYPADLDTTAVGWTADKEVEVNDVHFVMDQMLKRRNEEGIIQVYFDDERPRIDPIVCVNVLTLFHIHGRGSELYSTLTWILTVLVNRAYLDGTRYYKTAESFLYFFSRFFAHADASVRQKYREVFAERLLERVGMPGDSLGLAMRVLACASLGIRDEVDLRQLREKQCLDGGWEDGWFYRYGMTGIYIGNKGLTTAFAMNAINAASTLPVL